MARHFAQALHNYTKGMYGHQVTSKSYQGAFQRKLPCQRVAIVHLGLKC